MTELIVFDHDATAARWWVIRRTDIAVSLTAVRMDAAWANVVDEVRAPDGVRLYPADVALHRLGRDRPGCPALGRACDESVAVGNPHRLMGAWVDSGYDDQVIARELAAILDREAAG